MKEHLASGTEREHTEQETATVARDLAQRLGEVVRERDALKALLAASELQHGALATLPFDGVQRLYDFFGGETDPETEVTIAYWKGGHSGAGYYAFFTDCPEEGSIPLFATAQAIAFIEAYQDVRHPAPSPDDGQTREMR